MLCISTPRWRCRWSSARSSALCSAPRAMRPLKTPRWYRVQSMLCTALICVMLQSSSDPLQQLLSSMRPCVFAGCSLYHRGCVVASTMPPRDLRLSTCFLRMHGLLTRATGGPDCWEQSQCLTHVLRLSSDSQGARCTFRTTRCLARKANCACCWSSARATPCSPRCMPSLATNCRHREPETALLNV